jgi:hypothetical protein
LEIIKPEEKPKKPIYTKPLAVLGAFALIMGSYGIIFYANRVPATIPSVVAKEDVEIEIVAVEHDNGDYLLKAIPLVDKKEWGDEQTQFDIYWTISGDRVTTNIELGKSRNNQSGILKNLAAGAYQVKATIFYEGENYEKEVSLDVN